MFRLAREHTGTDCEARIVVGIMRIACTLLVAPPNQAIVRRRLQVWFPASYHR